MARLHATYFNRVRAAKLGDAISLHDDKTFPIHQIAYGELKTNARKFPQIYQKHYGKPIGAQAQKVIDVMY